MNNIGSLGGYGAITAGESALQGARMSSDKGKFEAMLDDFGNGVPVPVISRRFHDAFVDAAVQTAHLASALYEMRTVTLSGGVFMNRYLIENTLEALERAGFTVAINRELPPNDGCVSFGEAVVTYVGRTAGDD